MASPVNYKEFGPLYAGWARFISLAASLALAALLMFTQHDPWINYPVIDRLLLVLTFVGTGAGFVHGLGYVPVRKFWRGLFSPYVGWPLMLVGILWWIS
ncbi:MAG: cytochrome bd biosynthesis protein [Oceanospirillaceae bacterium]|nr:cytochrome bd biosynthesis protein [Oceanospirillaceae bacterium]MBT12330.1 cytochrome bd biosynthesis protein [Oceanospirillaceae bacterium]|tara:strand:+ start:26944 stop:27240 length:297 start_codon:yes stop_codon:yes gene_type:complete